MKDSSLQNSKNQPPIEYSCRCKTFFKHATIKKSTKRLVTNLKEIYIRSPKLTPNSNRAILAITTQLSLQNPDHLHPETDHSYNKRRSRELVDIKVTRLCFYVRCRNDQFQNVGVRVLFCRLSCVEIKLTLLNYAYMLSHIFKRYVSSFARLFF